MSASEATINHLDLYRLPWTLPDNAISWLEPTSQCNLACEGCYRENLTNSHKPLSVVREELEIFKRLRKSDGISIAGGDPLMHPDIVEIVRMVHEMGFKPILNTNGNVLTMDLLKDLKRAGVYGFTFHVDSKQGRPKWKNKNEVELNELRLEYARMLAEVGGISCSFNSTVYDDTLQYVPELVEWAGKHIDIVHVMVFILYRAAVPNLPFDWYAGGKKIDMGPLVYSFSDQKKVDMRAPEIVAKIRERYPDFSPCAYLNGTEEVSSFKWLLTGRVGTKEQIYGYTGAKFMEIMQTFHHLLNGRYLAYETPKKTRLGRSMLLLSPFDKQIRKTAKNYLGNPFNIFKRLYYQSVMIIQPVDFTKCGGQSMCDGCPDITIWNGELVWSCRMEELKHFGCWVRTVPRDGVPVENVR